MDTGHMDIDMGQIIYEREGCGDTDACWGACNISRVTSDS